MTYKHIILVTVNGTLMLLTCLNSIILRTSNKVNTYKMSKLSSTFTKSRILTSKARAKKKNKNKKVETYAQKFCSYKKVMVHINDRTSN